MKDGRPKRGMDRDLALKVLALCSAVKDALDDLLGSMFIIYQPKDWYGSIGDTASYTVVAMNVSAYRWQYSDDNGETWVNFTGTAHGERTKTIAFEVTESTNPDRIRRCRLTDSEGNYKYTDAVRMFITEEPEPETEGG